MRFPLIGVIAGLFLVGTIGAVAPYSHSDPPEEAFAPSELDPHDRILIEGDEDFIPANGVTGGSGTALDPYIIEGWRIEQYSRDRPSSIAIRGTLSSFVIRNAYLANSSNGISLENVANGRIENVTVTESGHVWGGIYLDHSRNISVTDSRIRDGDDGIRLRNSETVRIAGNLIQDNVVGMQIHFSSNLTIVSNDIVSNIHVGAFVGWGTNVTFQRNTFARNCCTDWQLGGNGQVGSVGLMLGNNTGVRVSHNDFVDNQIQARDDGGSENAWDDGYPSGGNYWSDYLGTDVCSGPGQDSCEGGDGLLDAPYLVDSNTIDRYPLQVPNDPDNLREAGTFLDDLAVVGLGVAAAVAVVLLAFLLIRRRRAKYPQEETRRKEGEGKQS